MLSFARTAIDYSDLLKTYQGLIDQIKAILDYIAIKLQAYFELYFLASGTQPLANITGACTEIAFASFNGIAIGFRDCNACKAA